MVNAYTPVAAGSKFVSTPRGSFAPERSHVGNAQDGVVAQVPLDGQVSLMHLRIFHMRIEIGDGGRGAQAADRGGKRRLKAGEGRPAMSRIQAGHRDLRIRRTRFKVGLQDIGVDDAAIVDAIAAAQSGLVIAKDVPCEADAGSNVITVVGAIGGLRQSCLSQSQIQSVGDGGVAGIGIGILRNVFVLVAQAER